MNPSTIDYLRFAFQEPGNVKIIFPEGDLLLGKITAFTKLGFCLVMTTHPPESECHQPAA